MKAQQLFKSTNEGFEPSGSWFCERCGNVYNNEESASRCCCCFECGESLEQPRRYGDIHEACLKIRNEQTEANAIEQAEKLDSWNGPVFWRDRFFSNLDSCRKEIYSHYHQHLPSVPKWLFVGKERPFPTVTIGDVICQISDEGYEGIEDDLGGVEELQNALRVFTDENKGLVSYFEDTTRMAPVPPLAPIGEGDRK